jgi:hypothetical protein
VPSGEKRRESLPVRFSGTVLRSGLSEEVAELRRFPAIPRGTQVDFSATQTVWRCRQSRTNRSPGFESLPNREKYRGGLQIRITMTGINVLSAAFKRISPMGSQGGTGIIINVSGMKVLEEN